MFLNFHATTLHQPEKLKTEFCATCVRTSVRLIHFPEDEAIVATPLRNSIRSDQIAVCVGARGLRVRRCRSIAEVVAAITIVAGSRRSVRTESDIPPGLALFSADIRASAIDPAATPFRTIAELPVRISRPI